jgi:hypothetical protein
MECEQCGCGECRYAAPLGCLLHWCCRACGWITAFHNEEDADVCG